MPVSGLRHARGDERSWLVPPVSRFQIIRLRTDQSAQRQDAGGLAGDSLNYYTAIVLDQAKALWRYWPDTEQGRLFQ